jgi:hypothetical protein
MTDPRKGTGDERLRPPGLPDYPSNSILRRSRPGQSRILAIVQGFSEWLGTLLRLPTRAAHFPLTAASSWLMASTTMSGFVMGM